MYNPSDLITSLHDLPRYGYPNTLNYVDDTWEEWNNYITGMSINPGIVIVFGLLALLTLVIVYGSVCCCRCCGCCRRLKGGDASKVRSRSSILAGFLSIAILIISAVCTSKTFQFSSNVSTSVSITRSFLSWYNNIIVGEGNLVMAGTALSQLMLSPPYSTDSATQDAMASMNRAYNDLWYYNVDISQVTDTLNQIDSRNSGEPGEARSTGAFYMFWPVLWLSILFVTAFIPRSCCAVTFKVLIVLGILFTWMTWMAAGCMFAVSIIGSDFCYAPLMSTDAFLDCGNCNELGARYDYCDACYYSRCDVEPSFPTANLIASISASSNDTQSLSNYFHEMPLPQDSFQRQYFTSLQTAVGAAVENVVDLLPSLFTCDAINPSWHKAVDAVCGGLLNDFANVFVMQLVQSVLLFVTLLLMVPFWNSHPSEVTFDSDYMKFWQSRDDAGLPLLDPTDSGSHSTIVLTTPPLPLQQQQQQQHPYTSLGVERTQSSVYMGQAVPQNYSTLTDGNAGMVHPGYVVVNSTDFPSSRHDYQYQGYGSNVQSPQLSTNSLPYQLPFGTAYNPADNTHRF